VEGKPQDDVQVAAKVSRAVRMESLIQAATGESWRKSVGEIEQKGYLTSTAPLTARLQSLKEHSADDAWKKGYNTAVDSWKATRAGGNQEEYDVSSALSPLESRLQSLAQQREVCTAPFSDATDCVFGLFFSPTLSLLFGLICFLWSTGLAQPNRGCKAAAPAGALLAAHGARQPPPLPARHAGELRGSVEEEGRRNARLHGGEPGGRRPVGRR
jgi:hypothetical protein